MVESYIIKIIMMKFNLNIKIISFELNVKNEKNKVSNVVK
jgi:hypothetical protein